MALTVGELIEILKKVNPDLPVYHADDVANEFFESDAHRFKGSVTSLVRLDMWPNEWLVEDDFHSEISHGVRVLEQKTVYWI